MNRFDGKNFITYGVIDGLPDARTDAGCMDSHNRLWINTRRGIAELKGKNFISYPYSDDPKIRSCSVMETSYGTLWALTNTGVYEFRNNKWWKLALYPGYENHVCREILETKQGMYVNYGSMIALKKPGHSWKIIGALREPLYYYISIKKSAEEVFVATIDGISRIKNDSLEKLKGEPGKLKGIYSFIVDSKKRMWIGSESFGLRWLQPGDTISRQVYKYPGINLISGIIEDRHGTIWAADYNGLVKITEAKYRIFSAPQIIDTPALRNIIQPPNAPLFINTDGLTIQEYKNGKFVPRKLQLAHGSLPVHEMIIDKYAFDDKGRAWYYLRGFTLALQYGNTIYEQKKLLAPLSDEVFDVTWDSYRKKILIAVRKQSFPCQYDEGSYSILPVKNKIHINGNIMRLHQCINQQILFATDTGAVYSIDKQNICKLQLSEFNSTGSVTWFCNDPTGDVWIAYSGRGLRRYRWQNDQLVLKEEINKANAIIGDYVTGLCFDDHTNLWVATPTTVALLSQKRDAGYKVMTSFSASDLAIENLGPSLLTKDNNGNVWLTAGGQVICFYPEKIMNEKVLAPKIQIEDIKLNLRETNWKIYADTLDGIFQLPHSLQLPYNKNTLGIYFKAVSSSGTGQAQYSYYLDPLNSTWTLPSSNDFVSYVNLPPGKYNFRVRTRLINSGWSETAIFSFRITEPFWETWWFRTLAIVFATAMIAFIFRYRISQVKTRNEMRNQLRELELKAFKLQLNPHFIHNALNSIQSLVINNKTNEAGLYINKFAKLLRQVFENSDSDLITLDKELHSLRLYFDLETLRMDMPVEYSVHVDNAIDESQVKIPPLILQPFIENALWHGLSLKEGTKQLRLNIKMEKGWIICEITDNGIGRKNAASSYQVFPEGHFSKAVYIIQQRLQEFNQAPGIDPVSFIDLDENGDPAGTRVIVRIRHNSMLTSFPA